MRKFFQYMKTSTLLLATFAVAVSFHTYGSEDETQPVTRSGWTWQVHQAELVLVDNLAIDSQGSVFATLEKASGLGQVVEITRGKVRVLVDHLNRPDGLIREGDMLFITEEVSDGRILSYQLKTGKQQELLRLRKPEGIDRLDNGDLVLAEDYRGGRLLRWSPSGSVVTLASGLNRPEGLRVHQDGSIYIAETGSGRILVYRQGVLSTLVEGLNKPDQLAFAPDSSLWIAEDSNPGRVLRYHSGKLDIMIENLASPQGMVFDSQGRLYLAEQHRHRILRVNPPLDR